MRTIVNGKLARAGTASGMVRSIPQIISELSRRLTLLRGTVILTGAPPLVEGLTRSPNLKSGDEVIVSVSGIGELTNVIQSVQ